MKLYISVGISGSGKSTYLNKLNVPVVCPDDIRKELTGDISDQSQNQKVWFEAYRRLKEYIAKDEDVAFSATSLGMQYMYEVDKLVLEAGNKNVELIVLWFDDSEQWMVCQDRVKADIENGVDRSKTADVNIDGVPLIQKMSDKYKSFKTNALHQFNQKNWHFEHIKFEHVKHNDLKEVYIVL